MKPTLPNNTPRRIARPLSALMLCLGLLGTSIVTLHPTDAQAKRPEQVSSCGAKNQKACTVFQAFPSCEKGLVELAGRCKVVKIPKLPPVKVPPVKLPPVKLPPVKIGIPGPGDVAGCGATNERPCRAWQAFPSCEKGLAENILSDTCVAAGPGHLRRQAEQALRDLKPLLETGVTLAQCQSVGGRIVQLMRILEAKKWSGAARKLAQHGCVGQVLEVARRNGYQTVTIGIGGSGQFGFGINSELGIAIDVDERYVPVGYATLGYTSGLGAALSNDVIVSFFKTDSQGIAGDAQGFAYSGKFLKGGGATIWYDYQGRQIGASAMVAIAGVGGEVGVYNRVTTEVLAGRQPSKERFFTDGPGSAPRKWAAEAGPIWNQSDANKKCRTLATQHRAKWTGHWWTTVPGRMSVCQLVR